MLDANVATIKKNREAIMVNADLIFERRQTLEASHHKIASNQSRISVLITPEQLEPAESSMNGSSTSATADLKEAQVQANKAKLYDLESAVMQNKFQAFAEREMIVENRQAILKNFNAALNNRNMANSNTDDIFKNRRTILSSLKAEGMVEQNFVESKLNEASIDFLEHRSKLTSRVAAVNERMCSINAVLIEINELLMQDNSEIVQFNEPNLEENRRLLDEGLSGSEATAETNSARIRSNVMRIKQIEQNAIANKTSLEASQARVLQNRKDIQHNAELIFKRRQTMEDDHYQIAENRNRIAAMLAEE
jgi:hypothetical protein